MKSHPKCLFVELRKHGTGLQPVSEGDSVELVLAPNQFDLNTIEVRKDGKVAGFLPRRKSAVLAPFVRTRDVTLLGGTVCMEESDETRIRIELGFDHDIFPESSTSLPVDKELAYHMFQEMLEFEYEHLVADVLDDKLIDSDTGWIDCFWELIAPLAKDKDSPESLKLAFWLMRDLAQEIRHQQHLKRRAEEEERRIQNEELAAQKVFYEAFGFEQTGRILSFGNLSVLPIRAVNGIPVKTLPEALQEGRAAFRPNQTPYQSDLSLVLASPECILAVGGTELKMTSGTCFVPNDCYVGKDEKRSNGIQTGSVPVVSDYASATFLRGTEKTIPGFPQLPRKSTGFAVFWGSKLRCIRLFGSRIAAVQALPVLLKYEWQIANPDGQLDSEAANEVVSRVLQGLLLCGDVVRREVYFGHQEGIEGGTARIDSGHRLMHVSVNLNGHPFAAVENPFDRESQRVDQRHSPANSNR